jgi:hypothetical protein
LSTQGYRKRGCGLASLSVAQDPFSEFDHAHGSFATPS